ncbi:EDD domain protein, DegV family [Dehalogenimonas alkenigignens]|uniref:EDD domain protein, DegV family n=1 Tax=Dehalogenimonas alkenigignens TaxID=1217799 RepID=A0A0W0GGY4_9CHLR|nr:DegV family protein [Dehalogenimonas alkenigignens]KTB47822.1 EDD domain protein, DegV family [Dehalogenimonas alkenigignens]
MTIRIVTDNTADIPPHLVDELGITVVPSYVIFGSASYRGGVDLTTEEFYKRLQGPVLPTTSQPTPQDFVAAYSWLAKSADGILSIHISSKLSGTLNSAEQAKKSGNFECPIEIIDSKNLTMALGLMVIAAAKMANAGKELSEIATAVRNMVVNTRLLILFDTLEYLYKGGRIGKAKSLMGSILNVKPLLTVKEGEFVPVTQVHSRTKGKEKLFEFVQNTPDVEEVAVVYATLPEEANDLAARIAAGHKIGVTNSRIGPVLGVHSGPGALAVALRTSG